MKEIVFSFSNIYCGAADQHNCGRFSCPLCAVHIKAVFKLCVDNMGLSCNMHKLLDYVLSIATPGTNKGLFLS